MDKLSHYRELWSVDFEFIATPGDKPLPVCMVAKEACSGRVFQLWQDDLLLRSEPPFSVDDDCLFVCFYAPAEISCFLALGWKVPKNVLDLFTEFRNMTNGLYLICGRGLLGALIYFGLKAMDTAEKDTMRDLVLRGGPWNGEERSSIINYCTSDVEALESLLPRMLPAIDLPRALLRGRYMIAVARMEHCGVPIDTESLSVLQDNWEKIQDPLIKTVDYPYQTFEGRTFKKKRWDWFLTRHGIPWPRLESGELDLSDEAFRQMSKLYPIIAPMREVRATLGRLRLSELAVGKDGRNRAMLSAFGATTGRNTPSSKKFVFGPARWVRSLIRPQPGYGLAYIDYCQQEFGIAAALSQDPLMMEAYSSEDPYIRFAIQARAAPEDATKQTHKVVRDLYKEVALAVNYGLSAKGWAQKTGRPEIEAAELLRSHKEIYQRFWQWSDGVVDYGLLRGRLYSTFGWNRFYVGDVNPRSMCNFPMQANGAEMLRFACIFATEAGIRVIAPVHDAVLIEFPTEMAEEIVASTEKAMKEASKLVLDGFELRTEAKLIMYPDRYVDEAGERMWNIIWDIIRDLDTKPD